MTDLSNEEKFILVQHAIEKYENEEKLEEKLKSLFSEKEINNIIATLISTQRVNRIGPEILKNNQSHTELAALPDSLKSIIAEL